MQLVSCIFILLSRESDQCAVRVRLGVAIHLSTTPRRGSPLSAFPNGTTSKLTNQAYSSGYNERVNSLCYVTEAR